jgi:hypothetical protein
MRFFRSLLFLLLFLKPACMESGIFPFQLSWDDQLKNTADFSWLNHKPAGVFGTVLVGADGHLYAGNQRLRFLGVDFTYKSTLPSHAEADAIARRLAKYGINIIRYHLMDADWGDGAALIDSSFQDTRHLKSDSLDRLDYFFARLKENGIYADLNLLAGRNFRSGDGLDSSIDGMDWKDKQIPAMFNPNMIQLQKEFASQLLEHRNPYTNLAYKNDPAVAIVEVVNEQGLLQAWRGGRLEILPAFFSGQLQTSWNQFLKNKYGNQAQLAAAWTRSSPAGTQMLVNPNFSAQLQGWNVEQHEGAAVTASVTRDGPSGSAASRLQVTIPSATDWHIQFNQPGLAVQANIIYSLSFWAKADRQKTITVELMQAHDPWAGLGFLKSLTLTTEWRQFNITLSLSGSEGNARLNFRGIGDQTASYWFSGFSLAPGGTMGLFPEESLDLGNTHLIVLNEQGERLAQASQDFARFLWELEENYWLQMRTHVKGTIGSQALLMGTIVGTSTPNLMSLFDMVDAHAYWQHPSFEVSWGSPWWIRNSSMLGEADGGTLSSLAIKRVQGKPFSVSEYNHPYPNSFGVEGFLILAAYAALQDWDAIFAYTYADGTLNWSEDRQTGYFDLHHDPGKMISLAHAATLFRRADISPAQRLVSVSMDKEDEIQLLPSASSWRLLDGELVGLDRRISLMHRVSLVSQGQSIPSGALSPAGITISPPFMADTGELDWDPSAKVLQISTPASKGVTGYMIGKRYNLGGFQIRPLAAMQNWAAITLSAVPPSPRAPFSQRFLLSLLGLRQNSQTQWQTYPGKQAAGFPPPADVNLSLSDWGIAPVQAEGIKAEFVFPYPATQVRVFALDGTGSRKREITVTQEDGQAKFQVSDSEQTLWYEIYIEPEIKPLPTRSR